MQKSSPVVVATSSNVGNRSLPIATSCIKLASSSAAVNGRPPVQRSSSKAQLNEVVAIVIKIASFVEYEENQHFRETAECTVLIPQYHMVLRWRLLARHSLWKPLFGLCSLIRRSDTPIPTYCSAFRWLSLAGSGTSAGLKIGIRHVDLASPPFLVQNDSPFGARCNISPPRSH